MKTLTFEQYQKFLTDGLRVKVVDPDSIFLNYACPVISIGVDRVTCDVDDDGGTASFDFNQVEITEEPILYDIYNNHD